MVWLRVLRAQCAAGPHAWLICTMTLPPAQDREREVTHTVSAETSEHRVDSRELRGREHPRLPLCSVVSTRGPFCWGHGAHKPLRCRPAPLGRQAGAPGAGLVANGCMYQWRRGLREQRPGGSVGAPGGQISLHCPERLSLEQRGLRKRDLVNGGQAAEDTQTSLSASWRPGRSR